VNWLSPFKERQVVITGEHGAFLADTLTADLTYYANGVTDTAWADLAQFRGVSEGDVVRYALNKREPLLNQHEAFRDALNGTGAEIVTMEQGSEALEVVDAALHSARTGQTVTLPTAGRLG
jgi:predicted dehydrogenase